MARSEEMNELYRALAKVEADAKKKQGSHEYQQWCAPLAGWSQEKHDAYHKKHAEEAKLVAHYCFIRQMQINPD